MSSKMHTTTLTVVIYLDVILLYCYEALSDDVHPWILLWKLLVLEIYKVHVGNCTF